MNLRTRILTLLLAWTGLALAGYAAPCGPGWVMTFNDEFNGLTTYDTSKWTPGSGTRAGNGEQQWYVNTPSNIDVTSGTTLRLTAFANTPTTGYPYSSGELHSRLNQAFGYFECRAKVPSGKGLWPAFWMMMSTNDGSYNWPPEIDAMEYIGSAEPKKIFMTNHYCSGSYPLDGSGHGTQQDVYNATTDVSQTGYHTYAVNWEPDRITWYVDDVARFTTTAYVPYVRNMYLLVNLAVGGYWPGNPDATTVFPAVYEVDYVRAYSRSLPAPWQTTDIGSPTYAGRSYAASSGLFNLMGSGSGLASATDQCHFTYLPLAGDGTLVARVKNEVGTNASNVASSTTAIAGLMIRESLDAGAKSVTMGLRPVVSGTAGGNVFVARATTGAAATQTVLNNSRPVPSWLKLIRTGSTVTGYSSDDGVYWAVNGTATVSMTSTVYAGMAVSASSTGKRATAQFDNISITGATPALTSIAVSATAYQVETAGTLQFTATARDQYGNLLDPQPAFTWTTSGGGTISTAGLFTATAAAGGPWTVTAASGAITGTAPVAVTAVPNAPLLLTATAATMLNGWIKLNWTDNSACETGYRIENKSPGGSYSVLATVTANVTTYTRTGLSMPSGPFYYRVVAINAAGDSAYSNEVTVSVPAALAGPSGLTAVSGTGQVALSWNAVPGATSYNIKRAITSGGSLTTVKSGNTTTTFTNTGLTNGGTYYYKVSWVASGVGESLNSNEVACTTLGTVTAPAAPLTLTATAVSASRINLAWTNSATNETGFKIERKTTSTGTYAQIATTAANVLDSSDAGLTSGSTYYYRVRATNAAGDSAYSPEAYATTPTGTPAAPSGLVATATSSSQITLTWTDNASNETAFKIERRTTGTYAQIATTTANVLTYANSSLSGATTYTYRVRASNAAGNSEYCAEAYATTSTALPAAPSGLTATTVSASQINLAWADNATNETGFKIERKATPTGTYAQIATTTANAISFDNTGLAADTRYYYRVRAANGGGDSAYCAAATAITPPAQTAPAAPSGLAAVASSSSQINLTWTDNADNETGFAIERMTTATGAYALVATTTANAAAYSDSGLAASTPYYYRITATNAVGASAYSNVANATTLNGIPAAPTGLTITTATMYNGWLRLNWTDNATNETGFKIEIKTGSATWSQSATVGTNTTTWTRTGLSMPSGPYTYRVRATNAVGDSAYSNEVSASLPTPPAGPTGLTATAGNAQVVLTWTAVAGANNYNIKRATTSGGPYSVVKYNQTGTTYTNTGLTNGTTYYYVVSWCGSGGESRNCAEVSAVPYQY